MGRWALSIGSRRRRPRITSLLLVFYVSNTQIKCYCGINLHDVVANGFCSVSVSSHRPCGVRFVLEICSDHVLADRVLYPSATLFHHHHRDPACSFSYPCLHHGLVDAASPCPSSRLFAVSTPSLYSFLCVAYLPPLETYPSSCVCVCVYPHVSPSCPPCSSPPQPLASSLPPKTPSSDHRRRGPSLKSPNPFLLATLAWLLLLPRSPRPHP